MKASELQAGRADSLRTLAAAQEGGQRQGPSSGLEAPPRTHTEAFDCASLRSASYTSRAGGVAGVVPTQLPPTSSGHPVSSESVRASSGFASDDGCDAQPYVKGICGTIGFASPRDHTLPSTLHLSFISNNDALSPRSMGGRTDLAEAVPDGSPPSCSPLLSSRSGRRGRQLAEAAADVPEGEGEGQIGRETARERASEGVISRQLRVGDSGTERTEEGRRVARAGVAYRESEAQCEPLARKEQSIEKTATADFDMLQAGAASGFSSDCRGEAARESQQEGESVLPSAACATDLRRLGQAPPPRSVSRGLEAPSAQLEQVPGEARDGKPTGLAQSSSKEGVPQTKGSQQLSLLPASWSALAEQCCFGDLLFLYNLRHSFAVPRESQQDAHPMSVFGLGEFKTGVWGKGGPGGPGGGASGAGPWAAGGGKKKENASALQKELQQQHMAVRWLLTVTGNGAVPTSSTATLPRRNRLTGTSLVSTAAGPVSDKRDLPALPSSKPPFSPVSPASGCAGEPEGREVACEDRLTKREGTRENSGESLSSSRVRTGWEQKSEQAAILGAAGLRKCRYVGLENLGATCYLNVYLQTLFMNVHFRDFLLSLPTLRELKDMERQRQLAENSHASSPGASVSHSHAPAGHPHGEPKPQDSANAGEKTLEAEKTDEKRSGDAAAPAGAARQDDGACGSRTEERCTAEETAAVVKKETEEPEKRLMKGLDEEARSSSAAPVPATSTDNPVMAGGLCAAPDVSSTVSQPVVPVASASRSPLHASVRVESAESDRRAASRARWSNWREKVKGHDVCTVLCSERYSLISSLQMIFAKLQEGIQAAVRPSVVADLLAEDLSYQEDANELQHRLFELLESELGGRESPLDFLRVLFGGRSRQTVQCSHCTYSGNKEEYFFQLNCCHKKSQQSGKQEPDRSSRNSPEQTAPSRYSLLPSPSSPGEDPASPEAREGGTRSPKALAASDSPACGPDPATSLASSEQWDSAPSSQEDCARAPASFPVQIDLSSLSSASFASRPEPSESKRRGRRGKKGSQRGTANSAETDATGEQSRAQGAGGGRKREGRDSCGKKGDASTAAAPGTGRKVVSAEQGRRPEEKGGWKLEEDMARQYQRTECLRGDSKYFCPQCGEKREAKKRSQLSLLPPYLQLVVLRYSIDVKKQTGEWVRRKIHEALEIPLAMDVRGCCTDDCQIGHLDGSVSSLREASRASHHYHLFGILEHQGASATSGHYTAITRDLRERPGRGSSTPAGEPAAVEARTRPVAPSEAKAASCSPTDEVTLPRFSRESGWREASHPGAEDRRRSKQGSASVSPSEAPGFALPCRGRGGGGGAQRAGLHAAEAERELRSHEECGARGWKDDGATAGAGGHKQKELLGHEQVTASACKVDSKGQVARKSAPSERSEAGAEARELLLASSRSSLSRLDPEPSFLSTSLSRGAKESRSKEAPDEHHCESPSPRERCIADLPGAAASARGLVAASGAPFSTTDRHRDTPVSFANPVTSAYSSFPLFSGASDGSSAALHERKMAVPLVVDVDAPSPSAVLSVGSSSGNPSSSSPYPSLASRFCSFSQLSISIERRADTDAVKSLSGALAAGGAWPAETPGAPASGPLLNSESCSALSPASLSSFPPSKPHSASVDGSTASHSFTLCVESQTGERTAHEDDYLEVCGETFSRTLQLGKSRGRTNMEDADACSRSPRSVKQKDLFSLEFQSPRSRQAALGRLSRWTERKTVEGAESCRGDRRRGEGSETQKGSCGPKKKENPSFTQRTLDQYVGRTRAQAKGRETGCRGTKGGTSACVSSASPPRLAPASPACPAASCSGESPQRKRRKRAEPADGTAGPLQKPIGRDGAQIARGRRREKKDKSDGENSVSLLALETPEDQEDEVEVEEFVILAAPPQDESATPCRSTVSGRHENRLPRFSEIDGFCATKENEEAKKVLDEELMARSLAIDEDLEEDLPEVILEASLSADKKKASPERAESSEDQDYKQSNSDVVETKKPRAAAARWSWVRFDDSEVSPFSLPRLSSPGPDSSAPRPASDASPRHQTPPRGSLSSAFASPSSGAAATPSAASLPAEEGDRRQATPDAARMDAASGLPSGRAASPGDSPRLHSRTVYMVTYIRADLTAEETDLPLPRELQDFVDEENERICEEQEDLCMRQQTLLAYVQQRQASLHQLLRHALPSALKDLEQQRQERVQKEAYHGQLARSRLPPPACERNLVNLQQRLSLLPQLRQLSFIPRSWWQQFIRGIDFPTMSTSLPPALLPRRDSNNPNAICVTPLSKADEGGNGSTKKRGKSRPVQSGAANSVRRRAEDAGSDGDRRRSPLQPDATREDSEHDGRAEAGVRKGTAEEDTRDSDRDESIDEEEAHGSRPRGSRIVTDEEAPTTRQREQQKRGTNTSGGEEALHSRPANPQTDAELSRAPTASAVEGESTGAGTSGDTRGDGSSLASRPGINTEEKGVIDYSGILCPHYSKALAPSASCWLASSGVCPEVNSSSVLPSSAAETTTEADLPGGVSTPSPSTPSPVSCFPEETQQPCTSGSGSELDEERLLAEPSYPIEKLLRVADICGERGVDPLSIWTGEAKVIPSELLSSLLAASSLRPSIPDPSLLPNLCCICSAALSGLVDFFSEQHRSIEAFLGALKNQKTILTCEEPPLAALTSPPATAPKPSARRSRLPDEASASAGPNRDTEVFESSRPDVIEVVDAHDEDLSPLRSEAPRETEKNAQQATRAESRPRAEEPSDGLCLPSPSLPTSASAPATGEHRGEGEETEAGGDGSGRCGAGPSDSTSAAPTSSASSNSSSVPRPFAHAGADRQASASFPKDRPDQDEMDRRIQPTEAGGPLPPRWMTEQTPDGVAPPAGPSAAVACVPSSPRAFASPLHLSSSDDRASLPEFIFVSRRPLQRAFALHACFLTLCTLPTASSPASVPFSALLPSSSTLQSRELKVLRAKMKREGKDSRERYLSWLTLSDVRREVTLARKMLHGADSELGGGQSQKTDDAEKEGGSDRSDQVPEEADGSEGERANGGSKKRRKMLADEEDLAEADEDEGVEEIDVDDEGDEPAPGALHAESEGKDAKRKREACERKPMSPASGSRNKAPGRGKRSASRTYRGLETPGQNGEQADEDTEEGQGDSQDALASRDNVFDFAADLLCCHQNLRVQGPVGKSSKLQRFLVPTTAILNFLDFEREKAPLYEALGIAKPLVFACSTFVSQYSRECSVCLLEQQAEQQRRQIWRDKRNEEYKALGPIIGKRWRLRKETGPSSSRLASPLPKKGRFFFVSTLWRQQWLSYVASGCETQGAASKPPPLDNSSLLCNCAKRGLKVDPSDTLLSPAFLADPPESETDTYILIHEDDIDLLQRFGLTGFKTAENLAMCVEVKHIPGEIASSLLSSASARSPWSCSGGAVPAFFFPALSPCSACVRAHRVEQGFYDFPPVDLSFHLRQNASSETAEAKTGKDQTREAGRDGGGKGGRRPASSRVSGQKKVTVRVSGETEIASLLAHAVASMPEAEETKEVTVYLEGPPRHVFYFTPDSSCRSWTSWKSPLSSSPPPAPLDPSASPSASESLAPQAPPLRGASSTSPSSSSVSCSPAFCVSPAVPVSPFSVPFASLAHPDAVSVDQEVPSAASPPSHPNAIPHAHTAPSCSSPGENGRDIHLPAGVSVSLSPLEDRRRTDGDAGSAPIGLSPSAGRLQRRLEGPEARDASSPEPRDNAGSENEGAVGRDQQAESEAGRSTLPLVSSEDEEIGKDVNGAVSRTPPGPVEGTNHGRGHGEIALRAVSLPHLSCLSLEVETKTYLRDLLLHVTDAWKVAYEFRDREAHAEEREKLERTEAETEETETEAVASIDLQEAVLESDGAASRGQPDRDAEKVLEIPDSEKEDGDGESPGMLSQADALVESQETPKGDETQARSLPPLSGESLARNKRERPENEPVDVLSDDDEQEEATQANQRRGRRGTTRPLPPVDSNQR
ncbi:putative ubiquitin carboxyl-terminal hydrolase [Neospora caninum Liverpool]|uniref:Putative ubiquitin carboxyl-terminal hydrolase n=1 Tax=Neospora caninum (strain Liverpool) TaxID=572307 RepID=F0VH93_NEOCL|nr:putative ubiquitin carboxyl-terminal hydrolase [Neospora caninum Liverpool]CBZ53087.1 putative ubiquitin carboxyl-terminal hydrolase [Neospora caninum Liverpool]|eukprot:XP_003883119.1 putative ubiquitin carboxyl-terminal hydrolase [Neospora caninum Liverpool]